MSTLLNDRFIEFSLGTQRYGVPLNYIQQVISKQPITKIPGVPEYYLGLLNLRGSMVSIIDLRKKMKIKPSDETSEEAVIVLNLNDSLIGILVDSVNKVLNCSKETLSDLPAIDSEPNNQYIDAIYKGGDTLTALLSVEKLFSHTADIRKKAA